MPFNCDEASKDVSYRSPEFTDSQGHKIEIGKRVRLSEKGREAYDKQQLNIRFKLEQDDNIGQVPIKYRGKVEGFAENGMVKILNDDFADEGYTDFILPEYLIIE